jgi:hypothetical protein
VNARGDLAWQHMGPMDAASMAAALDEHLIPVEHRVSGCCAWPSRLASVRLEINVRDRMAVVDFARATGSYYRELRELNPEIAQDYLPKGRYLIRVPPSRAPGLAVDRPPKPR